MKKHFFYILLPLLILTGCKKNSQETTTNTNVVVVPARTQVVAGSPSIHLMKENLTMNAVTVYTHRENIRATTTGYVQYSKAAQGIRVGSGQHLFSLKTKEAEALGEEILSDPNINITGVIPIYSKNSGIITQVFFQEGDYVVDGDVLAELTKPNSLAVKLYVPYEYGQFVKLQKHVLVRLPDGEVLKGTVRQLLPSEDVVSQTTPYLVTLTPFRFLPENLNVTVSVPTKSNSNALTIPAPALQSNEEQTLFWVMKIRNDTLAVRQTVELGMRTDSLIEIKNSQLTPTDKIVIQGAYGLPDTAAITLVNQL